MKSRYYTSAILMAAAAAGVFAWVLPDLPAKVPVHWNAQGVVDRHGSPWELFVVGPVMMIGLVALFAALPWLSPKRFDVGEFERTYLNLMLILEALLGYIFLIVLWSASGGAVEISRALLGGIALVLVLVGNLLGKVRRNFFIGIRTPWTLASERVWYATHRMGARTLVVGALAAFVSVLAGWPVWIAIALLVVGLLFPAVYSLLLYKKLERDPAA
jgi:uncharacterized membrane protein